MAKKCPECGGTKAKLIIPFRGPDIIQCPCGNSWFPNKDGPPLIEPEDIKKDTEKRIEAFLLESMKRVRALALEGLQDPPELENDSIENLATKAAFHARQAEKYMILIKRKLKE